MNCPNCGAKIEDDATFCGVCGYIVVQKTPNTDNNINNINDNNERHCPSCGAAVSQDDKYCEKCGTYIAENISNQNNNYSHTEKKSYVIPIVIAASACVIIISIIIIVMLLMNSNNNSIDDEVSSTNVAQTLAPTVQPTPIPTPVFTKIEASSTRGTDYTSGSAVEYFPSYAIDGDYNTAWSANRNVSLNPYITLSADTPQYVTGVRVANGYFKNESTYTRNRRITEFSIEYQGGQKIYSCGIDQYRIMQDIRLDTPVMTSYITVRVLDTYYGDWKDIAISEIEVY